jgi:hypothetical protein
MPKPPIPPGMMLEKYRGLVPAWDAEEIDVPYQAFLEEAKLQSPEMQQALAASTDKRFREYLRQLNLPKNRNKKASTLAKIMDISLAEFTDFLRSASRTRALSIAAQRLPEITSHMADDALTQKEACDGWGFVNVSEQEMPPLPEDGGPIPGGIRPMGARFVRDCPQCSGKGKLSKPGDSHAREKILLMNGISNKSAGVTVAINNNYGGHGIEAAGNRLAGVTFDLSADTITEGGDPAIEAERDWNQVPEHSDKGPADISEVENGE